MKKSGYVFSIAVMCLAVIVGAVGMTAAWFGDVTSASDTITVTSVQPSGTATIVIDSGSNDGLFDDVKLRPAVLKAGLGLNDRDGSEGYDTIAVPYQLNDTNSTIVDTANAYDNGSNSSRPFSMYATTVSTQFKVKFGGDSSTKNLSVKLTSVTLVNPRTVENNGTASDETDDYTVVHTNLKDYKTEFITLMSIAAVETGTPDATNVNTATAHTMTFTVSSRYEYYVHITVYFKYADEFTSFELVDTQLFFNFELETLAD